MKIIFDSEEDMAESARRMAGEHLCPKAEPGADCLLWVRVVAKKDTEARRAEMENEYTCANCWIRAFEKSKRVEVRGGDVGESAPEGPMPITAEMAERKQRAVSDACAKINKEIRFAVERDRDYAVFSLDRDDPVYGEVRGKYEKAGYRISPIGYCGGVMQEGEKITW